MRTKIRSLTPLLAAAGVSVAIALAPVAAAQPRCTTIAPEHHAVPDQRELSDRHLTPAEQLVRRLAVGRRAGHRLRRLGLGLVTTRR